VRTTRTSYQVVTGAPIGSAPTHTAFSLRISTIAIAVREAGVRVRVREQHPRVLLLQRDAPRFVQRHPLRPANAVEVRYAVSRAE
jgi:hypothetical protein